MDVIIYTDDNKDFRVEKLKEIKRFTSKGVKTIEAKDFSNFMFYNLELYIFIGEKAQFTIHGKTINYLYFI